MRNLEFIVDGQTIKKDPNCDFSGLVAGSSGYLSAHFSFSSEWDVCVKAASFWRGSKEYGALLVEDSCDIPPEALVGSTFKVSVVGQKGNYRIPTNRVSVRQEVR